MCLFDNLLAVKSHHDIHINPTAMAIKKKGPDGEYCRLIVQEAKRDW